MSFGNTVGIGDTLTEALDQGARRGQHRRPAATGGSAHRGWRHRSRDAAQRGRSQQALADAEKALADANTALKNGDFAAYGVAQKQLADAVGAARPRLAQAGSASPSPDRLGQPRLGRASTPERRPASP